MNDIFWSGLAFVLLVYVAFLAWKDIRLEKKAQQLGLDVKRLFGVLAVGLIGEHDGMDVEVRRYSGWGEHDSGHTSYTLELPLAMPPDLEIRPKCFFTKLGSFVRKVAGKLTGVRTREESDDEKGKSDDEENKSFEEIFSIDSSDREEALDLLEKSGVKQCLLRLYDDFNSVYVEEGRIGVELSGSQTATAMEETLDTLVEQVEQLGSTPRSSEGSAFGPETAAHDTGEGEHRAQASAAGHSERASQDADQEEASQGDVLW